MAKGQLKSGVYLSYMSLFVTNISNLIITPFIIRNLGDSQYGLYMLIGALIGYIAVLDFGLNNTIVRFVAKYRAEQSKEEEENFLFSTFIIYGIISIILTIIGIIIYFQLETVFKDSLTVNEIKIAEIMFLILIVNLAFTLPMKSFMGIMKAYEKFVMPKVIAITRTLIRMLMIFIFLSMGYKAIAIVLIDTLLNLVMLIISMLYVFLKLEVRVKKHYFSLSIYKEILSYSSLIFISVIVDQIYWRIGHFILGIVASTSEVAVFAIGMMLGQYFITFSTAISGVFLPKITGMVVNKATSEELTNLFIRTGRLQFLILALILGGFITVGKSFLIVWAGTNYEVSWSIAMIIMIPLFLVLTQTIGISILQAKNLHGFRALMYLMIAIINTFISIYLAKKYGAIGASVGTSLSLIFGNLIVMNFYYHFKVKLNIPRFFKGLFKGLMPAFILSLIAGYFLGTMISNNWFSLITIGSIYTIIYICLMWLIGMNKSEQKLIKNEVRKLTKISFN